MTDDVAPPAVFDANVVSEVAADHGVEREELARLLADHQAAVKELPGVENLVYEWRKQFDSAVLKRTETAYYVATPPWVWEEFADHLDASERAVDALEAAHARQVRADVATLSEGGDVSAADTISEGETPPADDSSYVVLARSESSMGTGSGKQ